MSRNWIVVLFVFASVIANAQDTAQYEAWQKIPHVRVGIKSPAETIKLYSKETLLVLDGSKVVGTISPNGRFYIIARGNSEGGARRYVQVRASKSESMIDKEKERLAQKYGEWRFLTKQRDDLFLLRVGPVETVAEGERVRKAMVREGYHDAFILTDRGSYTYHWVNEDFDKFPIKANNPALVRLNPNYGITYEGTTYRGILRFRLVGDKIRVINELPLETYLRGVVPSELGPATYPELEAQKAQAVAARTYTLKNMGRFERKGYDICDTPACQAYEGVTNENPLSDRAVSETQGLVLTYEGKLIDALYTSTCGGVTEDVENVFPGRAEPYLRGRTSYLTKFYNWKLPAKPVDRERIGEAPEDMAVRMLLWGFEEVPPLHGLLSGADLEKALKRFSWVLGTNGDAPQSESLTYREFWQYLSSLRFFDHAARLLVRDEDLGILLRHYQVPEALGHFAGLMIRHDLIYRDQLATLDREDPIPRAFAYEVLLGFCARLGPEPEWQRYRLEKLDLNTMQLSLGKKERRIDLGRYDYYVTDVAERWEFVENPELEEWDRIYLLQPPFTAKILRVKESGVVASLDRFSPYDSWVEKKDVDALEKRARRYIKGLRGIRDVRIVSRSETGRVTELAFDADSGTHKVKGLRIRWSLGVRDNMFDLLPGYRNGRLVHLTAVGRGWGHGVGMSQVGAFSLARMGWSFEQILTHYYTDVAINHHEQPKISP